MPVSPLVPFSYRAGSIVTIEVWNFVTYTHAAIHPSSRLNLIVGPNGSGKSSIVCAMCLGLGGAPTLLGRGNHAKDYVKHGENHAVIEISLATGQGSGVVVLKREIHTDEERQSDKSEWYLGGSNAALRKCKLKEIQVALAVSLSLCPSASQSAKIFVAVGGGKQVQHPADQLHSVPPPGHRQGVPRPHRAAGVQAASSPLPPPPPPFLTHGLVTCSCSSARRTRWTRAA